MKHKARTKALSLLLSLALLLSLLPGMSLTAYAYDGNPYASLVNTTTVVKFNNMDWYVIADNSTAENAGTVTLLAKDSVGSSVFGESQSYDSSSVKTWLTTYYNNNFSNTNNAVVNSSNGYLYLLSKDEADGINNGQIKYQGGQWWLRTGYYDPNYPADGQDKKMWTVWANYGMYTAKAWNESANVRPALQLDLSKVTYSTDTKTFWLPSQVVNVTGVTLNKTSTTIPVGGTETLTATVAPNNATDKRVKWNVSGTNASAVKLYSNEACTNEVGTAATSTLTVYAKGIAAGSAIVTATSNADGTKSASCTVTVHAHSFTYALSEDKSAITATCTDNTGAHANPYVATLTIAAPEHTAVGDGKSASATLTGLNDFNTKTGKSVAATEIKYVGRGSTNYAESATAPTDTGTYTAKITVEGKTATVDYEIINPDYAITPPTDLTHGSVSADKEQAKYGDTVTLTAAPDTGFALSALTVKDSENADVTLSGEGNTRSFNMPASGVTVSATFEGLPFGVTAVCDPAIGGTIAVSGVGVATAEDATTAKAGSEVTLTVTPGAGYELETLTVVATGESTEVPVTNYKFAMPTEAVTVSATFEKRNVPIAINVTGNSGTTCTATLLDGDYSAVKSGETLTKKADEKFILLINKDDESDYQVTLSPGGAPTMTEFTREEYEACLTYAKANNISVSLNPVLMWVTMPFVDNASDKLTVTVAFAKAKTFTVLYHPTDGSNPEEVWCRIGRTSSSQMYYDAVKMKSDSEMGNTKVWSVKVTAAFNPEKVGFFTSKADAEASGAAVSDAVVSQSADSWTDVTGGKYIIIGGNAKTVVAAFVDDASAMTVYDSETASLDYAKSSTGVRYQIAVCQTDDSGSVTTAGSVTAASAPATAPKGKTFDKWSALAGTALNKTENKYDAGQPNISIAENTIFTAVWKPEELTVTLNLNGGTGVAASKTVTYDNTLEISEPTRGGYVFDGWKVNKSVSEDGKLFAKGSAFDLNTKITANLELTAQWKHVHSYSYYKISDFPSLSAYASYADYVHVSMCACGDIKLEAHEYGADGKCACGYGANQSDEVTLKTSFGQMSGGTYTQKMAGKDRTEKKEQEVTVYAPSSLGDSLQFSKWIFTIDNGTTWYDLSTSTMVSFVIPCDMQLRALYINPITQPQVELSARSYDYPYQNTTVDAILFQMNYKLPDGYTFVDAGVRLGDNQGISYYELKEKTISMTAETQAIATGFAVVTSFLGQSINTFDTSASEKFYDKRENNVLDEMSAATLAEYMYESKPVNVEKYEPIYWETKATTKGLCGSINSLAPLRFAQKNNGDHYIYGIGWMRYKDKDGNIRTIYTEALDATLNGVLKSNTRTVTKSGS